MIYLAHYAEQRLAWYAEPDWWQAILTLIGIVSTLLLAYIAIYGTGRFRRLKFKYSISKIDQPVNGYLEQLFRIHITNIGKRSADKASVNLVKIYDKKRSKFYERKDFIHMPLRWTHYGDTKTRDIAVHEDVFVDVGSSDLLEPGLKLFTNPLTDAEQLSLINNNAKMKIRIIDQSGFVEELSLKFSIEFTGCSLEITNRRVVHVT